MTKIPKKKTYLRPKQCVLTCHWGLEIIEVGALCLGLVKESTKQKKISQNHPNDQKSSKKTYLGPKQHVLTCYLGLEMMVVGVS